MKKPYKYKVYMSFPQTKIDLIFIDIYKYSPSINDYVLLWSNDTEADGSEMGHTICYRFIHENNLKFIKGYHKDSNILQQFPQLLIGQ